MLAKCLRNYSGLWQKVPMAPSDPIFAMNEKFSKLRSIRKVNLGIGVYRDDNNKPWVLPSVQEAQESLLNTDHEYLPIEGLQSFRDSIIRLTLGDSNIFRENRVASCQTLSGTGGMSLAFEFLKRFSPSRAVYIPKESPQSYNQLLKGMTTNTYTYFNMETKEVDLENMLEDLSEAPKGSIVVLQPCGHNPTGADPNHDQWNQIQQVMAEMRHLALFDFSYQGLVSGDPHQDAYPVRLFMNMQNPTLVSHSCSASFGLYGERPGCFYMLCDNSIETERVTSQLKILARPLYSNPPLHGAKIASKVLNTDELQKQWLKDLQTMHTRTCHIREMLVDFLKEKGSEHDWSHIQNHSGWFSYTGLAPKLCRQLSERHKILMTEDGRISVTGLNTKNVEYVAEAFDNVTRYAPKLNQSL